MPLRQRLGYQVFPERRGRNTLKEEVIKTFLNQRLKFQIPLENTPFEVLRHFRPRRILSSMHEASFIIGIEAPLFAGINKTHPT